MENYHIRLNQDEFEKVTLSLRASDNRDLALKLERQLVDGGYRDQERLKYIAKAQEFCPSFQDGNDLEVDADAPLSFSDNGTWVGAWIWVSNSEFETDEDG